MTFVSAIYKNNSSTIIGGRGRDVSFFISSLRNIVNLGHPLVLYTSPDEVDRTEFLLRPIFKEKLIIIPHILESFKYFDKFIEWKKKNIDISRYINDRNETLCYSKAYWLKDAAEKNYFSTEKFAWIDSGLFHHGIFPESVGGVELLTHQSEQVYYPHNPKNIFTPKLGKNIENRLVSSKMFFLCTPMQGDTSKFQNLAKKYYNIESPNVSKHLVGGMFGSTADTVIQFANLFDEFLARTLDEEIYTFEEHIFSTMYSVYPQKFDLEFFDTWYFCSPGERTSTLTQEANSFYKIFVRLANS